MRNAENGYRELLKSIVDDHLYDGVLISCWQGPGSDGLAGVDKWWMGCRSRC